MIAALMCGGRGIRMRDASGIEKPLQRVKKNTMIERALHALIGSRMFEKIVAVTSINTPRTRSFIHHLCNSCTESIELMETAGHGFSEDLSSVVSSLKPARVFIVPVDLPLLNAKTVRRIIERCPADRTCVTVLLESAFVEGLGITASVLVPAMDGRLYCHSGISIINSSNFKVGSILKEDYIVMNEIEIAYNVNTRRELELAERVIKEGF